MSAAVDLLAGSFDIWLLDEDVWDNPGRLTGPEILAHTGPGWRRGDGALDDPEDGR